MTQFKVKVIGSLRNGYTATAEKVIASNVSHLSNAPMEVDSAVIKVRALSSAPASSAASASFAASAVPLAAAPSAVPLAAAPSAVPLAAAPSAVPLASSSEIWQNNENEDMKKLRNEIATGVGMATVNKAGNGVLKLVKIAAEKASDTMTKINVISKKVEAAQVIDSDIFSKCEEGARTMEEALQAAKEATTAIKAVENAHKAVKLRVNRTTKSNEAAEIIMKAMPMSKKTEAVLNAATMINNAERMSNQASVEVEEIVRLVNMAIKKYYISNNTRKPENQMRTLAAKTALKEQIVTAKSAIKSAVNEWNKIYDMITSVPPPAPLSVPPASLSVPPASLSVPPAQLLVPSAPLSVPPPAQTLEKTSEKKQIVLERLPRITVVTLVKQAADTSDFAMRKVVKMLGAVGSSAHINSTVSDISKEVLEASEKALTAASDAMTTVLDEEGEINEETMNSARNLSIKANTDVEEAVSAVNEAVKTQRRAKVIEHAVTISKSSKFNNSNIQNAVHVARSMKNVALQKTRAAQSTLHTAADKWEMIYSKMNSTTQGGRRKHTRRKHRKHFRCTRTHCK